MGEFQVRIGPRERAMSGDAGKPESNPPSAYGSPDARARGGALATLAAGLLVGQQVVAKAVRDTLFLTWVGIAWLPEAIVAGALLSACAALVVSRRAPSIGARRTVRGCLVASASFFALSWVAFAASERAGALLAYFHSVSLTAACVSAFWMQVTESFDPHAARKAVLRITSGATLGGVLGGLVTWHAATLARPHQLLLACAALNLLALACTTRMAGNVRPPHPLTRAPSLRNFGRELPYLWTLAGLVVLASCSQAILDYLLSSTAVTALGRGPGLLSFFALFQTVVGMLSFLLQVSVGAAALERLGVGGALTVRSSILVAGSLATPLVAPLTAATALRGADGVLGGSLERSAYEALFSPLRGASRRASKALVDVVADRLGTLAGGALVTLVVAVGVGSFGTLTAFVVALGVGHALVACRLQARYRQLLGESLRKARPGGSSVVGLDDRSLAQSSHIGPDPALGAKAAAREAPAPSPGVSLAAFDLPAGLDLDGEPDDDAPADGDRAEPADVALTDFAALRSGELGPMLTVLERGASDQLLAPQAIALLGDDRVAQAAADWLSALRPPAVGLLQDALLAPDLPASSRRRVARILGKLDDTRAAEALLGALAPVPASVRLGVAQALARLARTRPLPRARLLHALVEHASMEPTDGDDRLETLFSLLSAAYPTEPIQAAYYGLLRGGELRGTALEWLDALLPRDVKVALWPRLVRVGEGLRRTTRSLGELGRTLADAAPADVGHAAPTSCLRVPGR